jgi:hypothetical protein
VGTTKLTRGLKPHLHIVVISPPATYSRNLSRLFTPLTRDIVTTVLNPFRTADIVLRYLKGNKKSFSLEQQAITTVWRQQHGLKNLDLNNVTAIAKRHITPRIYEDIMKRGDKYKD